MWFTHSEIDGACSLSSYLHVALDLGESRSVKVFPSNSTVHSVYLELRTWREEISRRIFSFLKKKKKKSPDELIHGYARLLLETTVSVPVPDSDFVLDQDIAETLESGANRTSIFLSSRQSLYRHSIGSMWSAPGKSGWLASLPFSRFFSKCVVVQKQNHTAHANRRWANFDYRALSWVVGVDFDCAAELHGRLNNEPR